MIATDEDIFDIDLGDDFTTEDPIDAFTFNGDISVLTNEHLCDVIIAFQYLGVAKEHAVDCMNELALRRQNGNMFSFEDYIRSEFEKLPKFNASIMDSFKV